jgi:hypothetical protein
MPLTFDRIDEGADLPGAKRTPSSFRVMQFMGASWMWGPQFYDQASAEKMGLSAPIIPGPMKAAFLDQYLRHWLDGGGHVTRLQLSHRRPDLHNVEISIGGTITRKYEEDGEKRADLEVFIDNPEGERSVRGAATVVLNN